MLYSPHDHALILNIPVVYRELTAMVGLWIPAFGVIMLHPGMSRVLERSVLAHEIAHAELGHTNSHGGNELHANIYAAHRLVDPGKYRAAQKRSSNRADWAADCGVTLEIIEAFTLPPPRWRSPPF